MSDPSPSGETWVCTAANALTSPCTERRPHDFGGSTCGPVPSSDTPSDERDEVCGSMGPRIGDEPERQWVCHKPGWMGACSPQSTHHNGFDWGCGWIYFPAPSTPGEGTGRPLPEFQMVACADHMLTGHRWRCRACRREVERQFQECCEEMWRLQRTTPAPPASPVPPTPTPCPYIVTGGEGTSYCSLAERSAMHAAAPPSTPADPRPTDPTGSEA